MTAAVRVKIEPGEGGEQEVAAIASVAALSVSDEDLVSIFFDLQQAWQQQRQVELDAFIQAWGPMLPADSAAKGKRRRDPSAALTPNPHWPAQELFITAIDAEWNYCDKPIKVSGAVLSKLVRDMLTVDLKNFDLVICDAAGKEYNCRNSLNGDASDECSAKLLEFFDRILSPAYETYTANAPSSAPFDFLKIKNMHFGLAAPALADLDFHSYELRCNAPAGSPLMQRFCYFFKTDKQTACKYASPYLDLVVAFFMWFYYTCVLRPFIHCMPLLYPDSSLIQNKGPRNSKGKWIQSLQPSDATPVLNKALYTFLGMMSKNSVFGELETAVEHNVVVSDRAEAMLLAMQVVIEAQDALDLEESQNARLLQVQNDIAQLLARKNKNARSGVQQAVTTTGAMHAAVSQRSRVKDHAVNLIKQYLICAKAIPVDCMQRLFDDLSTSESGGDIIKLMLEVMTLVHRSLIGSSPTSIATFHKAVESWNKIPQSPIDSVLVTLRQQVRNTPEIARSRPRGS